PNSCRHPPVDPGEVASSFNLISASRKSGTAVATRRVLSGRLRFIDHRVMEVTVARALHDRLRALETHALIVALTKRGVALAGEQVPDLTEPHVAVHLGIFASGYIE